MREPRDNAVPCANASLPQVRAGVHMTRNFDRVCDRCRARMSSRGVRVPGVAQAPPPSSPPACSPVVVPEVCMASRGDGIFDDGFLSDPVALVSGSKRPQPQYRTLEVRPAHHPI